MKAQPTYYRGISFVRLHELPAEQQQALQASPNHPERIKILMNNNVFDECIQYAAYSDWYSMVYKVARTEGTFIQPQPERKAVGVLITKAS
ncbi:MAG: hypothetical protein MUE95_00370 [Cyclobacteriaceae bacterium]|nr:hypothetical protein [Cyclobacteriaceae bacterium]